MEMSPNIDISKSVRYTVRKEVRQMIITNITNLRKNLYDYIDHTIVSGDPTTVTTKNGNAVILSETEYNGILETLHLMNMPGTYESLKSLKDIPLSECIPESEVEW